MKTFLFSVFFLLLSSKAYSQEYIFGKVLSEDQRELRSVTVINISTQQTTTTNEDGNFMLFAKVGDEIRFAKERYYRVSERISSSNISKTFVITLIKMPHDIEEVEIKYKLTGDLKKDADHFGKSKKMLKFDEEMSKYVKSKSSPQTLAPQKGEFVQPVGPMLFSITRAKPQWDDVDLNEDLRDFFTDDFFVNELKLKTSEIPTFIFYVLQNFERKDIIKSGLCSYADYARFREEAILKISDYKKNKPNTSKNKKNKLQLKDKNTQNGLWWN